MKKKILGMLVCVLLIASVIPTVESLRNSSVNTTVPSAPLTSMAANWTEIQKLLASDGATGDEFGFVVAVDGNTALIGAVFDSDNGPNSGSAYVFTRTGTTWTQQAKLLPSFGAQGYCFGYSVSLDGDTALIGEPYDAYSGCNSGSAFVFTRSETTWTEQAKLLAPDGEAGDCFGGSVSLYDDTALIGASSDNDNGDLSGSAYIFSRSGATWTQQQKLIALDGASLDRFGCSVSLHLDTALIGAYWGGDNRVGAGCAYVFTRTGATWTQQQKLLATDGAAEDLFGYSVSLHGNTALIGAYADDDNGSYSGSAYVFTRTGTTWSQQEKLLPSDGATFDFFGFSVALSVDTAIIGAPQSVGNGDYSGSVYVFSRTGTSWTQQTKLLASDGAAGDNFGWSVSLDDNTALIGAFWDDDNGDDSGSAYVFKDANGNQLPLADFSWTPPNSSPNQQITFNASASNDPDGTITLYEWDWNNDGVYEESYSSPATTHSWATAGSYSVTLRVTDDDDATNTITKTVNVSEINLEINLWGGIGVNADIGYNGTESSLSVNWQLQVKGGILGLIHRNASGAMIIQRGESRWVSTGLFFGVGPFTVVAKANEVEKTAKGIVILFYVIILN